MKILGLRINPEINISEIITVLLIFVAGVAGWNHHEFRIAANEKEIASAIREHENDMILLDKQRAADLAAIAARRSEDLDTINRTRKEDRDATDAMFRRIESTLSDISHKLDGKAEK